MAFTHLRGASFGQAFIQCGCARLIGLCFVAWLIPTPGHSAAPVLTREEAVQKARAGDYDAALPVLRRLVQEQPGDLSIQADLITVLQWAGKPEEAVAVYAQLTSERRGQLPAYALSEVAPAVPSNWRSAIPRRSTLLHGVRWRRPRRRWRCGAIGSEDPRQRFVRTAQAIQLLEQNLARFRAAGPEGSALVLQTRFDLIVAWRDRFYMRQVVDTYEQLRREQIDMPGYLCGWYVLYEPHALCWILMPETLRGLWRQRLRWAQGGAENAVRHIRYFLRRPFSGLGPIYVDYCLSILWAYAVAFSFALWSLALVPGVHLPVHGGSVIPESWGLVLCLTFLLQAAISMWLDGKYERGLRRTYFWMIWYPLVYWMLIWATALVGFPKGVRRRRPRHARWQSPDRGVRA